MTNEIDISKVLIEGDTATIMGVKYKRVEEPKTPAEEAYKRWWGDYPPTTPSVSNFDDNMWSAFQKGYTSAKEDYKVGEYQPTSQEPETLLDVIRNLGYSYDCCYEIVDAVEKFEKSKEPEVEDYLTPQTPDEPTKPMNEVLDRLENKYENDDVVNRMLKKWEENPPDFLRFELSKSLEALITRWWDDVYDGIHQDWDREVAIDDLIDQIQFWLPKSQSAAGSQSLGVEDMVEGFNDCLNKIKSKLRNKKDT